MGGWFEGKDASRKFIDLIRKTSSKWANWDPPLMIQVGSYGKVNDKSGAFQVQGNIYDFTSKDGQPLFQDQPERSAIVDEYKIKSSDDTCREIKAGVSVAGTALVKSSGRWQFGSKRGAFLVMVKCYITSLPQSVKNSILASEDKSLRDLKVVTRVFHCHSYCLYLSNKSHELVEVQLALKVPVPAAPGIIAGGDVTFTWDNEGTQGLFQQATGKSESFDYTPLYEIEKIRGPERRRDAGPIEPGGDRWDIIPVPWGPLDSDGEEEIAVPDGSDDEDDDF